ncbi:MAG: response regulator transcription factor [Bacteroidetes bacterium]|nr:response regulator transcription factor [Bacteroidota bacterium]MBX7237915.1 response regulator transcription factor [Bacteroidia bacterium]MCC7515582.1 response regulator transcription factor [Bacteroidia bacterium]MCW5920147.1 response regulator transcription factor [Bacteroidota bacterium]HCI58524.1 DNA-binding response regulator [Bacteroidota bacterium]
MNENILIVDDDKSICEILEFNLKSEGYIVDTAYSAEEALTKLTNQTQLILLDVMMEGMSGYKMLEKIRLDGSTIPVIFLTAKNTENDMLTGFSVGADDYISKPFSIKEVSARIKAILKRFKTASTEQKETLAFKDLEINTKNKEAFIKGKPVNLTKTEFEILQKLAKNPNRIFSRQEIIEGVWGNNVFVTERTVDVHITRLRKKLEDYGNIISNRLGYGYKFDLMKL